jgi:beta-hydroxyacyl-ACP dehydratase FabZ
MGTTLDIMAIMRRLPHRYPFLLIDRIIDLVPGESITALKNVSMNEPFFQGHFPSQPVMPGVLIVEAMAQAGGVLASESRGAEPTPAIIYFMGMDQVRFRRPVVPGDQLVLEARILKIRSKVAKMAGRALVGGTLAAEAELMASFGEGAAPA